MTTNFRLSRHQQPSPSEEILYTADFVSDLARRLASISVAEDDPEADRKSRAFRFYRFAFPPGPAGIEPAAATAQGLLQVLARPALLRHEFYRAWPTCGTVLSLCRVPVAADQRHEPAGDRGVSAGRLLQVDFSSWRQFVVDAHAQGKVAAVFTAHVRVAGDSRYEPFLMDLIDSRLGPSACSNACTRTRWPSPGRRRAGMDLLYTGDDVANRTPDVLPRSGGR